MQDLRMHGVSPLLALTWLRQIHRHASHMLKCLQEDWAALMVQYARRNAERQSNLCVAAPSTPAQLFHVLRRQMNRPFAQPLVLLTPKSLHVHTPATSALVTSPPALSSTA